MTLGNYILFGKLENGLLLSIGSLDLEFLYLGYQNNGKFNESDIENSGLKRLGVGRTLDAIASLKERDLVTQNDDGTFSITNTAKQFLWNDTIPTNIKILRLLKIKAFSLSLISKYLVTDKEKIEYEIEPLRKKGLVLMSPQRTEAGLEKIFEIMDAGTELLEKVDSGNFTDIDNFVKSSEKEVFEILDELQTIIDKAAINNDSKEEIFEKINLIKSKLKI